MRHLCTVMYINSRTIQTSDTLRSSRDASGPLTLIRMKRLLLRSSELTSTRRSVCTYGLFAWLHTKHPPQLMRMIMTIRPLPRLSELTSARQSLRSSAARASGRRAWTWTWRPPPARRAACAPPARRTCHCDLRRISPLASDWTFKYILHITYSSYYESLVIFCPQKTH